LKPTRPDRASNAYEAARIRSISAHLIGPRAHLRDGVDGNIVGIHRHKAAILQDAVTAEHDARSAMPHAAHFAVINQAEAGPREVLVSLLVVPRGDLHVAIAR